MTETRSLDGGGLSPELLALQRVVAGRYSIVRELGRGGMGIVFLARDVALERPVAIKLLPPMLALNAANRTRFVREARTAAALSHPNIVPIHSVEEHADLAFFVMGFVDGETLSARVARSEAGQLRIADLIRVTQEVAWALAHAHGHGVVHRDIKPDNVLIERDTGRAIVTDFGIARIEGSVTTSRPDAIVGTPRYMSPEQANGDAVDGRSDIYSLGAVAYFAATGHAPIDADSSLAILARKVLVDAPPLAGVRPEVPARFATAVDRCLARDRSERWASAEELAVAIRSTTAVREVPVPIRDFVRQAGQVGSEIETALTAAGISALMAVLAAMKSGSSGGMIAFGMSFVIIAYMGSGAAMAGLAGIRGAQLVARARRLLKSGYGHSALVPALLGDAHEQDASEPPSRSRTQTIVEILFGAAATVGSLFLADANGDVLPMFGFAGSVAIPTLVIRRILESRPAQGNWWSRLLRGRLGRAMFRLAGLRLGTTAPHLPAIGESTSVALRDELTSLYAALPSSQRNDFAALPELALRLERQAAVLRDRTPNPETDRRLQSVVAALEMLRLDLLRFTLTDVDTADLTRDLDEARRLSDDIDARLHGDDEVGRLLRSDT